MESVQEIQEPHKRQKWSELVDWQRPGVRTKNTEVQ